MNEKTIVLILEALDFILQKAIYNNTLNNNPYALRIIEIEMDLKFDQLQINKSNEVYKLVVKIMENHFELLDEL